MVLANDNCTLFPEGNWSICCARHDRRYERIGKHKADLLLFRCVKRYNVAVAFIMFIGVSLFGHYNYYKAQRKNR